MPGTFFIVRNAVLLPQVDFFIVVGLLFVQRNSHKLDLPTRKCVKYSRKRAQNVRFFSIRNYPKMQKNAYFGRKSAKFFRGRALGPPPPPLIGRLRLLFRQLAKMPAENPVSMLPSLFLLLISGFFLGMFQLAYRTLEVAYGS